MDTIPPIPHTLQEWLWVFVAGFLAWGASYLPAFLKRRQTDAEIQNTFAGTRRTEAETRNLELQSNLQAGDIVLEMIREVAAVTLRVQRLEAERDHWKRKAEYEEAARYVLEKQLEPHITIGRPMEREE